MSYIITNMVQRLNRELDFLNNKPLHDIWGIIENPYNKLTIYVNKVSTILIYLNIRYYKKIIYNFKSLPLELSNIICRFLTDYISIKINIKYPLDYPLMPPQWDLNNIKHNLSYPPIDINHYYSYIIHRHNKEYNNDWIPAMTVESDILNFVQKINHFDYLLE